MRTPAKRERETRRDNQRQRPEAAEQEVPGKADRGLQTQRGAPLHGRGRYMAGGPANLSRMSGAYPVRLLLADSVVGVACSGAGDECWAHARPRVVWRPACFDRVASRLEVGEDLSTVEP